MTPAIDDPHNARSRRTRDALFAATREILERDGYEALTMAAVASRAGVSRRAVYLHFASRTDLLTGLFDYVAEQEGLHESVAAVWDAPDAAAALRAWVRHLVRYHPKLMALDRVGGDDPDGARHVRNVRTAQAANCRRLAEWLAADGTLAPAWTADTAADMLMALISTDLFDRLLNVLGWTPDALEEHLITLYERTFLREEG